MYPVVKLSTLKAYKAASNRHNRIVTELVRFLSHYCMICQLFVVQNTFIGKLHSAGVVVTCVHTCNCYGSVLWLCFLSSTCVVSSSIVLYMCVIVGCGKRVLCTFMFVHM